MLPNTVYSMCPCSLCLSGPRVMRWERPTTTTAVTGAASPWSRPHPPMPEMPTQNPERPSNPSLSPLILWDRVSSKHLNNTHTDANSGPQHSQCGLQRELCYPSTVVCIEPCVLRWLRLVEGSLLTSHLTKPDFASCKSAANVERVLLYLKT